jgi:multisubunit Na+/H+ antiporter MnhB subunit
VNPLARRRVATALPVAIAGVLAASLAAALAAVLVTLPDRPVVIADSLGPVLHLSGAENPVTAVLLNFRAYDTLMEVAVLIAAVAAVWAMEPGRPVTRFGPVRGGSADRQTLRRAAVERLHGPGEAGTGAVISSLLRLVLPLILLTSLYLAWAGSYLPGGAFQAGALLAGGAVLLILTGRLRIPLPPAGLVRAAVASGLAVFLAAGVWGLVVRGRLLAFPPAEASAIIMVVEVVLTLSIAAVLAALFAEVPVLGERPES